MVRMEADMERIGWSVIYDVVVVVPQLVLIGVDRKADLSASDSEVNVR